MTRGRENNVAHLVAENLDDARQLWIETFGRDRADLGPAHAAQRAAEDLERYAPHRPLEAALADLRAAWTDRTRPTRCPGPLPRAATHFMAAIGEPDPTWVAELDAQIDELRDQLTTATDQVRASLHEPAIRSLPPGRVEQEHADWLQHRRDGSNKQPKPAGRRLNRPRPSRGRPPYGYPSTPDRGRGISR